MPLTSTLVLLLAQNDLEKRLDDFVLRQMNAQHIPGLVLRVEQHGKVLLRKAYGYADLESKRPMKVSDKLDVGSIGKSFTAATLLKLSKEGKCSLDDPVGKYLDQAPDSWKKITLRQLLGHMTGLPDYALVPGIGLADSYDGNKWWSTMAAQPFDFETGRMHQYSNTNFVVLGYMIEKATGKKYQQVVKNLIFRPAGLKSTQFEDARKPMKGIPMGYFFQEGANTKMPEVPSAPMPSDGGSFSTVDDLAKFFRWVQASPDLAPMIPASQLPGGRAAPYGLGIMRGTVGDQEVFGHGGNNVGFSAGAFVYPSSGITVTMLCNLYPVSGQGFCNQVAQIVNPSLLPKPLAEAVDQHPALTAELQEAFTKLCAGDIRAECFNADMQARLATGRGQMSLGAYRNFRTAGDWAFIDSRKVGPDQAHRYRVTQENGPTWILEFTVDTAGKVYSVGRQPDPGKPKS